MRRDGDTTTAAATHWLVTSNDVVVDLSNMASVTMYSDSTNAAVCRGNTQ